MFEQWDSGAPARRSGFSEEESACYGGLFRAADPEGTGAVDGEHAVELLRRSGLPEPTLRRIWELSDPGEEGLLPPERFGAAMRLVAHAQAGQVPSAGLAAVEPPRPPEFAAPAPQAQPLDSGASSQWEGASCSSASTRSRRPIRWAPSERETRKYASLFLRTDADGDGFVEAREAKALCDRSGLGEELLARAWSHADQDGDGRLTFREFVALLHSVSCCREGLELPSAEKGLPQDLRTALGTLTRTPEELHRQRSRSPSRSTSTSRSASPAPAFRRAAPAPLAQLPWAEEGGAAWRNEPPVQQMEKEVHSRYHRQDYTHGVGGTAYDGFDEPPKPRTASAAVDAQAPASPSSVASPSSPGSPNSPRFGGERWRQEAKAPSEMDLQAVGRHLRAMIEADREVLRHVTQEADDMEKLVRSTREACKEILPQAVRERDETRHLGELLRQLRLQLSVARQRLAALQEERRGRGSELAGSRDRKHFEEMHDFMRQTLEEEARMVEETRHANRQLEQSCANLAGDVAALERQRQGILEELLREEEGHREDQLELTDLKGGRRQRDPATATAGQREGQRQRTPWDASPDRPEASPPFPSRHSEPSWGSSLVGGNIFAPSTRAAALRPGTAELHARSGV